MSIIGDFWEEQWEKESNKFNEKLEALEKENSQLKAEITILKNPPQGSNQRISYVYAADENEALSHGLSLKDVMEGIYPDHTCNCNRCPYKDQKVFKIRTEVLQEVPYQDPNTIDEDEPENE